MSTIWPPRFASSATSQGGPRLARGRVVGSGDAQHGRLSSRERAQVGHEAGPLALPFLLSSISTGPLLGAEETLELLQLRREACKHNESCRQRRRDLELQLSEDSAECRGRAADEERNAQKDAQCAEPVEVGPVVEFRQLSLILPFAPPRGSENVATQTKS
jgi:hypothetical protein